MPKQIVFIDSRVADYQSIIANLDSDSTWFLLNPEEDGVLQMAMDLVAYHDLDAIHVIGHGSSGVLQLGSTLLNNNNLNDYRTHLNAIGASLSADGDVLLYGCDVAQGDEGLRFIGSLAQLTGADVVASNDVTGNSSDWQLEVSSGQIDGQALSLNYPGLLALPERHLTSSTPTYFGHSMGEFRNSYAFAAIKDDGSVVTWGESIYGGDSSSVANQLNGNVVQVFSNGSAFAALRADGSIVTWGNIFSGGDSRAVAGKLDGTVNVVQVFSTLGAFAALREDGSVVTWGDNYSGGDSNVGHYDSNNRWITDYSVANQIDGTVDVKQVFSNWSAFAALRTDGSVVTWGARDDGGDSSKVTSQLDGTIDITQVFSGPGFAALRADGSVVTWSGADSSAVASQLNGSIDVVQVFSTIYAFAALRADGSVVTWGNNFGDTFVKYLNNVVNIYTNHSSFAALRYDGSVYTWGYAEQGGNSSAVIGKLDGKVDVVEVFSTIGAFAALLADGSVATWGYSSYGGDSSAVASKLDGTVDVVQVFSTSYAFAALREDGSVVTWGSPDSGGDSSTVASKLDGTVDVVQVFATDDAFAALLEDGSVVTWGKANSGGDSSSVISKISSGVVSLSDIYSNINDTSAPLINTLSPTDNATSVPVASNLVWTFNEAIQAGSGNIELYNSDGTLARSIAITDPHQISIVGNTLTINPVLNLTSGSGYYLNMAPGVIEDLAGNDFAGITDSTTYNFTTTTVVPSSKQNDFVVLQFSSPNYVSAGDGDDTYFLSQSMLPAGTLINITDPRGNNSIQLADGLEIASSQVASNALQLTLSTGAIINVFGADQFTYEAGGNMSIGIDQADVGFSSFIQNTLGITTVPVSGVVSGGPVIIELTGVTAGII